MEADEHAHTTLLVTQREARTSPIQDHATNPGPNPRTAMGTTLLAGPIPGPNRETTPGWDTPTPRISHHLPGKPPGMELGEKGGRGHHVEALLGWAEVEYARVAGVRGTLRDALGYTVRQKDALRTFLQDARLEMTNNGSERELRQVVVGRKAWLFFGSQEHAESAGELMSLIASARLHKLNPQQYLNELIRVLPHWPTGRYLELSPARWEATRERLSPAELALEIGHLTVPPPLEQQRGAD